MLFTIIQTPEPQPMSKTETPFSKSRASLTLLNMFLLNRLEKKKKERDLIYHLTLQITLLKQSVAMETNHEFVSIAQFLDLHLSISFVHLRPLVTNKSTFLHYEILGGYQP